MYIRKVTKQNKNSDKQYIYYRLVHGYKVGDKVRQQTLLNLGKLDEELPVSSHKALADRIEMLLTGSSTSFFSDDPKVERLAEKFVSEIRKQKVFPIKNSDRPISKAIEKDYETIDMSSIESKESRDIGGEWLCKQAFDEIGMGDLFSEIGMDEKEVKVAKMLLTAKLIHPSSELETERWLKESSAAVDLYNETEQIASRYRLYKASEMLYDNKTEIEKKIYSSCSNLFKNRNKIVIYDLTNFYFEGQKRGSKIAEFGRSKEKRSDCRLIGLSMAIDSNGFVRHSQIHPGNIGEPTTLNNLLEALEGKFDDTFERPVVIMDAGISTDANLQAISAKEYDYVSVSRLQTKEFTKLSKNFTTIYDNRGNKIEVEKVSIENQEDSFLHIKSDEKRKKEESMDQKMSTRFEEQLNRLKDGLSKPRRMKKTKKVYEKVGVIKSKYARVSKLYTINYTEDQDNDIITDMTWKRSKSKEKKAGEYFLRYSKKELTDREVWDIYNLTREVESSFRCLKTDLNIRPIHHQKDEHIESHIWLGILAYQVVNFIRQKLKLEGINYSWKTIVEKLRTQQSTVIQMDNKDGKRIYTKLCSDPITDVKSIYRALNYKERPYVRITKVVTQK
jgi:hypothetical protein